MWSQGLFTRLLLLLLLLLLLAAAACQNVLLTLGPYSRIELGPSWVLVLHNAYAAIVCNVLWL